MSAHKATRLALMFAVLNLSCAFHRVAPQSLILPRQAHTLHAWHCARRVPTGRAQLAAVAKADDAKKVKREQMAANDRTFANIESHPEGFNALRRMYENVEVPMQNAIQNENGYKLELGKNGPY